MFDKWQDHVAAMSTRGLRCEGASGDRTVRVDATTRAADAGPCALAIVATKVMDIERRPGRRPAHDRARDAGPRDPERSRQCRARAAGARCRDLLFGIAGGFGAELKGPGHVHHNGMEAINLAELAGRITPRLESVAEVWRGAGFTVNVYDDLWPVVWSKLVANVAFSAICTVTGMRVGQVRANEAAWAIAAPASRRRSRSPPRRYQARLRRPGAVGVGLRRQDPERAPVDVPGPARGRCSEIDAIHGGVVGRAPRSVCRPRPAP